MYKSKIIILAAICAGFFAFSIPASASDFDGTQPMICAMIDLVECAPGDGCKQVSLESMALPQFVRIDFKKKMISGTLEDGTVRSAKIEEKRMLGGNLILQGAQNGRGWSVVIPENSGKMNMAVSGDGIGFFVSGACTIP